MRNISKQRYKIGFILCLFVIILLMLSMANINISQASAVSLSNSEIDEISREMTKSEIFDVSGEQKNIKDYPNYLYNRFQLYNRNYNVLNQEDEWIKAIVPEELFRQKTEDYFYIGDEYGFYFDYNAENSTYLIYFIDHFYKYKSGNLEQKIEPIYYENYVYNEETKIVSLKYVKYVDICTTCNPCYYPKEHNISRYHYVKYSNNVKLFLKDVNFTGNLYNENHLNVGEYGYDPYADNGDYFIGNQYYFNGVSTQSGKGDFLIEIFKMGIGYIPLGTSGLTVGDAMNLVTFISEYANFIDVAKNDFRKNISNMDINNFIDIEEKLLARDQIRESGGLYKSMGTQFETSNDKEAVLYGINNNNYVINRSQIMNVNQSQKWDSRFSGKIKLDIVKEVPDGFKTKVVDIANVESNDWHCSLDNGYSTEIELYEKNQLYILNDAEHKVKFVAPENGNYTFSTHGNVENTIKYLDAPVIEIDEYNKQMIKHFKKGEEFFLDVKKVNFVGSDYVGIEVEFTPEEIKKDQTKTLTIEAGETEFFLFNAETIGYSYNINSIDDIEFKVAQTTYYNTFYNHFGKGITGSVIKDTGMYYISLKNTTENSQKVELNITDVEELNIDITNEASITYQKAFVIELPYSINVNFTAKCESYKFIEIYNNDSGLVVRGTSSSYLNFTILSNQLYFIVISDVTNVNEQMSLSFEKRISSLRPTYNYFNVVYKDGLLLYNNENFSGDYFISSGVDFVVYNSEYDLIEANVDGSYILLQNKNYYFYLLENGTQCDINFTIKSTTSLSGVFSESEVIFIKFKPALTGQYKVTGTSDYSWYSENLEIRYGELSSDLTYYLMFNGSANTLYNIEITYQEIVRTEIPLKVGVERDTGIYYFVIEQSGNYTFKTYRNSDTVNSTISVYSPDGTKYVTDVCTDLYLHKEYLVAGTYYLDLTTTPSNETVTIRINKSR